MHSPFRQALLNLAVSALTVAAFLSPRATAADAADNPGYAQWAGLKDGAWVRVRVLSSSRNFERTTKVLGVTPDEAKLEETEAGPGEKPEPGRVVLVPARREAAADKAPPGKAKPDDAGESEVPVAGLRLKCHWETHGGRRGDAGGDARPAAGDTTWTCPGVPGFVKRDSWLPAEPALGLPEVNATEQVVAWDLPPRGEKPAGGAPPDKPATAPAEAGGGGLPVRVGPPTKFSWTYRFDPPGWRHWSRLDESTWEEQWQSGQTTRARVVGWLADDPGPGTVVRRGDGSMETLIPDAGKGAKLLFRGSPDGKWTVLGEVEESE